MAVVVLSSTMSFTVNMHYCGSKLVDLAFFHKPAGCGMEVASPATEGCSFIKKNCCDDKQLTQNGQDELKLSTEQISFDQKIFIASFVFTYISLYESVDKEVSSYERYKPPLVTKNIYQIDETYLI